MGKSAIVLGATGLVGSHLVARLLDEDRYDQVKVFVRRPVGFEHPKLDPYIVDFDHPEEWRDRIRGNDLFSCLGTTLTTAGSREAQYRVDYTYQYGVAKAAVENGAATYVLVSSSGANPDSIFFYPRMRGELDRDVQQLRFQTIRILKPSVLSGVRTDKRIGESMAVIFGNLLLPLIPPLRKYRPIPAATVAKAMIHAANDAKVPRLLKYELEEIFQLANQHLR